jgi:hypothetical protein
MFCFLVRGYVILHDFATVEDWGYKYLRLDSPDDRLDREWLNLKNNTIARAFAKTDSKIHPDIFQIAPVSSRRSKWIAVL